MLSQTFENFYQINFVEYFNQIMESPLKIFTSVLDIVIVIFNISSC